MVQLLALVRRVAKNAIKCLGPFIRKIENEVCKVQRLAQKQCFYSELCYVFGSMFLHLFEEQPLAKKVATFHS